MCKNTCFPKTSIQNGISDIEGMKDKNYTVISNYIKDVKSLYSVYKNRKNLFGFLRFLQIAGGFAITTMTTYNNPYWKENTDTINIVVWYVSISNNIISLIVERLTKYNLDDEKLKIKLLITEGIKYDEGSENYSFYKEERRKEKMKYFKKTCKNIIENSTFGFLTRSETEPEHIAFINERKIERLKQLWTRVDTPEGGSYDKEKENLNETGNIMEMVGGVGNNSESSGEEP
tara:strand:+ start:1923 stop:2618 length:696 start_codon:yes stop_codon:yes gene_type:complete